MVFNEWNAVQQCGVVGLARMSISYYCNAMREENDEKKIGEEE